MAHSAISRKIKNERRQKNRSDTMNKLRYTNSINLHFLPWEATISTMKWCYGLFYGAIAILHLHIYENTLTSAHIPNPWHFRNEALF